MGLFRDRAVERAEKASYERKVAKMRGVSNKVNAGRSIPKAAAPHPCPDCGRTVRGGVCPGPDC